MIGTTKINLRTMTDFIILEDDKVMPVYDRIMAKLYKRPCNPCTTFIDLNLKAAA